MACAAKVQKSFRKASEKRWNLARWNLAPCLHSGFLSEASVAAAPSEKRKNSGACFSFPEARNWKETESCLVELSWVYLVDKKYCNANWGERSGAGGHLELPPIHGMPHLETFPSQSSSQQTSSRWVCVDPKVHVSFKIIQKIHSIKSHLHQN